MRGYGAPWIDHDERVRMIPRHGGGFDYAPLTHNAQILREVVMAKATDYVEAEGMVHLLHPHNAEFTLCGDAYDLASEEAGYEQKPTRRRTVDCPTCVAVVTMCRGVRVA
jgi:hypothetical protein